LTRSADRPGPGLVPDRDAFLSSGMAVGVREGYERLDAVLAG
jgi:hypothetical protein